MNDILIPADPADLIDRIIDMQLRIDATTAPHLRADLVRKRELLVRLAARIMPSNDTMAGLTSQLYAARSDFFYLAAELKSCDARKDHGTAFVALTQSLLSAMAAVDDARAAINSHVVLGSC